MKKSIKIIIAAVAAIAIIAAGCIAAFHFLNKGKTDEPEDVSTPTEETFNDISLLLNLQTRDEIESAVKENNLTEAFSCEEYITVANIGAFGNTATLNYYFDGNNVKNLTLTASIDKENEEEGFTSQEVKPFVESTKSGLAKFLNCDSLGSCNIIAQKEEFYTQKSEDDYENLASGLSRMQFSVKDKDGKILIMDFYKASYTSFRAKLTKYFDTTQFDGYEALLTLG